MTLRTGNATAAAVTASLLALAGCKTIADGRTKPTTSPSAAASDAPAPKTSSLGSDAGPAAAAAVVPEAPLPWGARPPGNGPLWPVVDGMCVHGEIWPTRGSVLYTYGNGTGAWTRGSTATLARFGDEGLVTGDAATLVGATEKTKEAFQEIAPMAVVGTWPGPLLLYSADQHGGRMRDWPSIWRHEAEGWSIVASHREPTAPDHLAPVLFQGHAVTLRREIGQDQEPLPGAIAKAFPLDKSATPIPGLSTLFRSGLSPYRLVANETSLFLLAWVNGSSDARKYVVRVLTDGKVKEHAVPVNGEIRIVGTRPNLVVIVEAKTIFRLEGESLVKVTATPPPPATRFASGGIAPNGDLWLLAEGKKAVAVVRATGSDVLPLPAPASPRPKENVQHWPTSGDLMGGVEVDDPYVIGDSGSLFHFVSGRFEEVPLPEAPFAQTGRYQAQAVVVPERGSVFVNAGYAEKGTAWKTAERYRAVLRNKRPKEVFRCNEPWGGSSSGSGSDFMSFPPIATDACTTPVAILLRLGYGVRGSSPTYIYDRKSDYPGVREAIKATPSLGSEVELVEIVSGDQRYLAAKVPTVASGKALAEAVVKKIQAPAEVRPEIVCGQPKAERTLVVDVATAKVTTPVRAN